MRRLVLLLSLAGCGVVDATATPDAPVAAPDAAAPDAAPPPTVPRYGLVEQSFSWPSAGYSNPWEQVTVTMTLTPPGGADVTIGGFYAATDLWKTRFSPWQTGAWTWRATIGDGTRSADSAGSFVVVDSARPGFLRIAANGTRWVFDDGTSFWPVGLGDCVVTQAGDPLSVDKSWGFDGPTPGCTTGKCERRVDIDTYLSAYAQAGFNVFRWSVDNCAFDLKKQLADGGNVYGLEEGQWGDELAAKLRQYDMHIFFTLYGFGIRPSASIDQAKRYARYVVDRYAAVVDFWELTNEFPNPPETVSNDWYTQLAAYIRSIDPYRHPISTSWERPDLAAIEINAPHWYQTEDELVSDSVTAERIHQVRAEAHGRALPVIFGEQGNTGVNWYPNSALRMRIRIWTAFFKGASFIFWNESSTKGACPPAPAECNNPAANIYLGPQERALIKVFGDFTRGFDARAEEVAAVVSAPDKVRAYALRSPSIYAAYLHAYTDHQNPTSGLMLTVEPLAAGTATWMDPTTGAALGAPQAVAAGTRALAVPAFTVDAALVIR